MDLKNAQSISILSSMLSFLLIQVYYQGRIYPSLHYKIMKFKKNEYFYYYFSASLCLHVLCVSAQFNRLKGKLYKPTLPLQCWPEPVPGDPV